MSKQVLDIEQMKHLKELGLDISDGSMIYIEMDSSTICVPKEITYLLKGCEYGHLFLEAFTLQDILDILPKSTKYGQLQIRFCEYPNGTYGNEVVYDSMEHNGVTFFCENVIDSAYEMLCLCIKEGFIKTNKED